MTTLLNEIYSGLQISQKHLYKDLPALKLHDRKCSHHMKDRLAVWGQIDTYDSEFGGQLGLQGLMSSMPSDLSLWHLWNSQRSVLSQIHKRSFYTLPWQ